MKRENLRAWNSSKKEMAIATSSIDCWFQEEYEILLFCDCEDANGIRIFQGDILTKSRYNENGKKEFVYYPVIWNDRKLMWSVDVGRVKNLKHLEPLTSHINLLVVGNIHQGVHRYGHNYTPFELNKNDWSSITE